MKLFKSSSKNKDPEFRLFGIFGFPLSHTLSPAMHEAAFRELGIEAHYLVLEMTPDAFQKFMAKHSGLLLSGFNVTVPYKETVLKYLDKVQPEAKAIGAVNTVYRRGRQWLGTNTDMEGFLMTLIRDGKFRSRGKKAVILGAGGAARALVYGLAREGVKGISLVDSFPEKARGIAKDMRKVFPKVSFITMKAGEPIIKDAVKNADIIVNATPLGLKKKDPLVIPEGWIPAARSGKKFFMDLIYNPARTPFLKEARRKGHQTMNGLGMLLYQGAKAFEYWTGKRAPVEVMRKALLQGLKGKGN